MNDNTKVELMLMILDLASSLGLDDLIIVIDKTPLPEPTQGTVEALARIANELRGMTTKQHELNARWDMAYLKWQRHKAQYHQETGILILDDECAINTGTGWLQFVHYFPNRQTGARLLNPPLEHVEAFERYVARLEQGGSE